MPALSCFNPRARDGREATEPDIVNSMIRFNPRARDGREQQSAAATEALAVSIHAPVMDAKYVCLSLLRKEIGFNPRARDGRE